MKLTINLDKIQIIVRPFYKTVYQLLNFLYYKVPHFCFNKKLFISGNCRMCIVEVENMPKPVVSCALPVSGNLTINTKTPFVSKARENVLEFLLNNHPLDCPVCDQGGECDLQELSKYHGSGTSRFFFKKATTSSKNINSLLSTSMNRCINCTKCVRLAFYIGVNTMSSVGRSIDSQIFHFKSTNYAKNMYLFSSLIEICPVGKIVHKNLILTAFLIYTIICWLFLSFIVKFPFYLSTIVIILSLFSKKKSTIPQNWIQLIFFSFAVFISQGNILWVHFFKISIGFMKDKALKFFWVNLLSPAEIAAACKGTSKVVGVLLKKVGITSPPPSLETIGFSFGLSSALFAADTGNRILRKGDSNTYYKMQVKHYEGLGKDHPDYQEAFQAAKKTLTEYPRIEGIVSENYTAAKKGVYTLLNKESGDLSLVELMGL